MLACHAGGPGSIPGRCIVFTFFSTYIVSNWCPCEFSSVISRRIYKKKIIQIDNMFLTQNFTQVTNIWQLWDSNPRPFGLVPKTSALDHSAKLPLYWSDFHIAFFKQLWSKKISPTDCNLSFVRKICFFLTWKSISRINWKFIGNSYLLTVASVAQ